MSCCQDLYTAIKKDCPKCIEKCKTGNFKHAFFLHLAVNKPNIFEEFLAHWVKSGLDINALEDSSTILHKLDHSVEGCTKRLELLLKYSSTENFLNEKNCLGDSPLSHAIDAECSSCIEILIANGVELSDSFLHKVAQNCDIHTIKKLPSDYLIANINKKDKLGWTPLMHAIANYEHYEPDYAIECIKFLLECGASLNEKDNRGHEATDFTNDESLKQFLQEWQDLPS